MYSSGTASLSNCILWGNSAPSGAQIGGTATVAYCDIQGGYGGTGNIDADPQLDANRCPQAGSPVIDTGNSALLPADTFDLDHDGNRAEPTPLDIGHNLRVIGPAVDMGAYERRQLTGRLYAKPGASGQCTNWAEACDLSYALDYAVDGAGSGRRQEPTCQQPAPTLPTRAALPSPYPTE